MTPSPEKFQPLLPYLIYGQIILLAAAILVGGFLVLRRLSRKQPIEGQILEEKEKLAAEINEEIIRLRELRDRLFDGFQEAPESTGVGAKTIHQTVKTEIRDNPELLKKNQELQKKVEELLAEIAALRSAVAAPPKEAKITFEMKDEMRKELEGEIRAKVEGEVEQKMTQQQTTIQDLSNRLQEYEIFEEELAQIKKYKLENAKLKEQATAGGMPTNFSEEDIAQLFSEMTNQEGGEKAAEPSLGSSLGDTSSKNDIPSSEMFGEPTVNAAQAPQVQKVTSAGLDAELESLLKAGAAVESTPTQTQTLSSPASEEKPPIGFEAESVGDEPAVPSVDHENAEALAVLGADEDELMKEFEKVLTPKDKDG
jgi:hypothetical protein